jgi:hypothetical protein
MKNASGRVFLRTAALCLGFSAAVAALAQQPETVDRGKPTFATFEVPGAGGNYDVFGTFPRSINAAGVIVGLYNTATAVNGSLDHGFVRAADGAITSFDVPGIYIVATEPEAINAGGTITGYYRYKLPQNGGNPYDLAYGFVRAANGIFTTFAAPGAGNGDFPWQGTFPMGINAAGTIAGYYTDANGVSHGFTGTAGGTLTSFDAPGAGTGAQLQQGTFAQSINAAGDIAGYYVDGSAGYGFLRTADGAISTFSAPAAVGQGTQAWSINAAGTIAGYYSDAGYVNHGFVRAASGAITSFDAPGAGTAEGDGTFALSIDASGGVAGYYLNEKDGSHGFMRSASGAITSFEAPGAITGSGGGTFATSIGKTGVVAGYYWPPTGLAEGFLMTP